MLHLNRWYTIVALMFLLFLIEYSPLVIPSGQFKPMFLGLPFSLWLGIIGAALGVFLTYLASKIYRKTIGEDKN